RGTGVRGPGGNPPGEGGGLLRRRRRHHPGPVQLRAAERRPGRPRDRHLRRPLPRRAPGRGLAELGGRQAPAPPSGPPHPLPGRRARPDRRPHPGRPGRRPDRPARARPRPRPRAHPHAVGGRPRRRVHRRPPLAAPGQPQPGPQPGRPARRPRLHGQSPPPPARAPPPHPGPGHRRLPTGPGRRRRPRLPARRRPLPGRPQPRPPTGPPGRARPGGRRPGAGLDPPRPRRRPGRAGPGAARRRGGGGRMIRDDLRNVAIVAHVDHGKTTLVDAMLRQSGGFRANQEVVDRVLDSMDLEREKGITILAKQTAVEFRGVRINVVDTPGHADFGGEVERTLRMVDAVLLLVDASEGPLPQTRYVLGKALARRLPVVVCVNKVDRADARPAEVVAEVEELFLDLDADEDQIGFPILYANARAGRAGHRPDELAGDLAPLLETIVATTPPPAYEPGHPLQFLVTNLDADPYVGRLAVGRLWQGEVRLGDRGGVAKGDGGLVLAKVTKIAGAIGLSRSELDHAGPGEIVAVAGLGDVTVGGPATAPADPRPPPGVGGPRGAAPPAPPRPRPPAGGGDRRAQHLDAVRGQHLPVRRQRRHLPDQPAPQGAAGPGGAGQRGHPGPAHRLPRHLRGPGPGRAPAGRADRAGPPRGLRAGGVAARGHHPDRRRAGPGAVRGRPPCRARGV